MRVIALINNAALMVALAAAYSILSRRWQFSDTVRSLTFGVAGGAVAIAGMHNALLILPGIIFDARTVILSVGALFGGAPAALISAALAGGYRLWIGGPGAWTGVGVIASAAALGAGARWARRLLGLPLNAWLLLALGTVVHAITLVWMLALPGNAHVVVLPEIAFPVMVVFPSATVLLGLLFKKHESHARAVAALRRERDLTSGIAETCPVGIAVVDESDRITFANARAQQILHGREPVGRRLSELPWRVTDLEGAPLAADSMPIATVRRTGLPVRDAFRAVEWPDGTRAILSISAAALPGDPGAPRSVMLVVEDISEQIQTRRALAESLMMLTTAERTAGMGSWRWDFDTERFFWSDEVCRILGVPHVDLGLDLEAALTRLVHPDDRVGVLATVGGAVRGRRGLDFECRIVRPTGEIRHLWVRGEVTDIPAKNSAALTGFAQDVTLRKEGEKQLRRSNRFLKLLGACNQSVVRASHESPLAREFCRLVVQIGGLAAAWVATGGAGLSGMRTAALFTAAGELPFEAADLLSPDEDGLEPATRASTTGERLVLRDLAPTRSAGWRKAALRLGCREAAAFPLRHEGHALGALVVLSGDADAFDEQTLLVLGELADDLAYGLMALRARGEHEVVRDRLRSLVVREQSVREDERNSVSRMIHDKLGQELSALQMDISWLAHHIHDEAATARLRSMTAMNISLIRSTQEIAMDLRPQILDDLGLAEAVAWHVEQFEKRSGIPCSLSSDIGDRLVDPAVATAAFRSLQELLTNVFRHARARSVLIDLRVSGPDLVVVVGDDGVGIDPAELTARHSLGILGVRERIQHLGGRLDFHSAPLAGTRAEIRIPAFGP